MTEEQKAKRDMLLDNIEKSLKEFNEYNGSIGGRVLLGIQEYKMVQEGENPEDFKE